MSFTESKRLQGMVPTDKVRQNLPLVTIGAIFAWLAVIVYASSNSIVTLLVDIGKANPVASGRNAITYCNLLFLGSLISVVPMVMLFHKDWTRKKLARLSRHDWAILTVSAFLSSAVTPGLFFYALEHTTVTNVILIGRIEPPLFLLATWAFLNEDLNPWAMWAGLVALVGAVVMIGMRGNGALFTFGAGELATIAATLSFIASTIVTRVGLKGVPLGIFSVYRTVLGTALYFLLAMYLFGPGHFQDLFAPVVLKWIWIYAIVVIVIGQFSWNLGLKYARSGDVSLATSFSPLAAIIIAMYLLGEDPGPGLVPGGLIILAGIAIGQIGRRHSRQAGRRASGEALEHEGKLNFKGA
ncbi:DMT family transporter [Roseovarius aestuarii]|uniref:EamA-like transporter family protein n=1 Tax=Roseovarius aestuarii TaxID=475083 RepID=A0A1X7BSK1_9RHOB|nr:DMT family transporter [Roseovarius aestuarii]SMC12585.1 EamA-like transporter family protein [Roseovarius aestuarii]